MHAERPVTIVKVGKASEVELPTVMHIYTQHGGNRCDVGCDNTFVARNETLGVVGAVTIQQTPTKGVVRLRTMGVEKNLRESGIGSQLLSQVIEELRKDGVNEILITFNPQSSVYKKFFKKRGFEEVDGDETRMKLYV